MSIFNPTLVSGSDTAPLTQAKANELYYSKTSNNLVVHGTEYVLDEIVYGGVTAATVNASGSCSLGSTNSNHQLIGNVNLSHLPRTITTLAPSDPKDLCPRGYIDGAIAAQPNLLNLANEWTNTNLFDIPPTTSADPSTGDSLTRRSYTQGLISALTSNPLSISAALGQSNTRLLAATDSTTGQWLGALPACLSGSYNPLASAGDTMLVAGPGAASSALVLTKQSGTTTGLRVENTKSSLVGGAASLVVDSSGNTLTSNGVHTFSVPPVSVTAATTASQLVNKGQMDAAVAGIDSTAHTWTQANAFTQPPTCTTAASSASMLVNKGQMDASFSAIDTSAHTWTQANAFTQPPTCTTAASSASMLVNKQLLDQSVAGVDTSAHAWTQANAFTQPPTCTTAASSASMLVNKQLLDQSVAAYKITVDTSFNALPGQNFTWTGSHAFNGPPPTSYQDPLEGASLCRKYYVDALVSNVVGNNNSWTGTNAFNTSLPTSTLSPSLDFHLVNRLYVDSQINVVTLNNYYTNGLHTTTAPSGDGSFPFALYAPHIGVATTASSITAILGIVDIFPPVSADGRTSTGQESFFIEFFYTYNKGATLTTTNTVSLATGGAATGDRDIKRTTAFQTSELGVPNSGFTSASALFSVSVVPSFVGNTPPKLNIYQLSSTYSFWNNASNTTSFASTPKSMTSTYDGLAFSFYPIQFSYNSGGGVRVQIGAPNQYNSPCKSGWVSNISYGLRVVAGSNGATGWTLSSAL